MRILHWMQNKLNGKSGSKKQSLVSSNRFFVQEARQEFSDWPQGLLAIGTFGNIQSNEDTERLESSHNSRPPEDLSDFTPEEVGKLQKELTKFLALKPSSKVSESGRLKSNLPLDMFLNCPSSLEVDRTNCQKFCHEEDDPEASLSTSISVILGKSKDVRLDGSNAIKKKSVSFLLKRMFACHGGFPSTPSLRYQLPESRMEKLLKAILHNKICPQNAASSSTRKYLGNKQAKKTDSEDEWQERASDGSKWVKTDSEFIVLEI